MVINTFFFFLLVAHQLFDRFSYLWKKNHFCFLKMEVYFYSYFTFFFFFPLVWYIMMMITTMIFFFIFWMLPSFLSLSAASVPVTMLLLFQTCLIKLKKKFKVNTPRLFISLQTDFLFCIQLDDHTFCWSLDNSHINTHKQPQLTLLYFKFALKKVAFVSCIYI